MLHNIPEEPDLIYTTTEESDPFYVLNTEKDRGTEWFFVHASHACRGWDINIELWCTEPWA